MKYELTIGWLYPELMSTYGDRGNIICLKKRCKWREIGVEIKKLDLGFKIDDLRRCDLLFMGGAQDTQQKIVSHDFSKPKIKTLKEMVEDGIPGLYVCGSYQFLGKYYKEANRNIIDGLRILDLYTENPGEKFQRLIGNIVVELSNVTLGRSEATTAESVSVKALRDSGQARMTRLVGFENHGGRTFLGKAVKPLGKVLRGFGNNGNLPAMQDVKALQTGDKTEGAVYRNTFGSYLHGPILPKNPHFADYLIKLALERKYKKSIDLSPLNDSLEWRAHEAMLKKLNIT